MAMLHPRKTSVAVVGADYRVASDMWVGTENNQQRCGRATRGLGTQFQPEVITGLVPSEETATNLPLPYVTETHLLLAAAVCEVQVSPLAQAQTRARPYRRYRREEQQKAHAYGSSQNSLTKALKQEPFGVIMPKG